MAFLPIPPIFYESVFEALESSPAAWGKAFNELPEKEANSIAMDYFRTHRSDWYKFYKIYKYRLTDKKVLSKAFFQCIQHGYISEALELLLRGIDTFGDYAKGVPLMYAAALEDEELVLKLLALGHRYKPQFCPFSCLNKVKPNLEFAEFLYKTGARLAPKDRPFLMNKDLGRKAIHWAIEHGAELSVATLQTISAKLPPREWTKLTKGFPLDQIFRDRAVMRRLGHVQELFKQGLKFPTKHHAEYQLTLDYLGESLLELMGNSSSMQWSLKHGDQSEANRMGAKARHFMAFYLQNGAPLTTFTTTKLREHPVYPYCKPDEVLAQLERNFHNRQTLVPIDKPRVMEVEIELA